MSFASFFHIWPTLHSKIFEHLLYFLKFGRIPIFVPFPVSKGSQESSSPKAYRESPEHPEGTSPRWAGEVHKLTDSMAARDPAWVSFWVSTPEGFCSFFPGKQLCPYPSAARQSLAVPRPPWFPTAAWPQLSLGIFLQRNKQNPINLHFLPKSPRGGVMEMTRRTSILGNYHYFIMLWNQERTDCLGKKFPFSLTCQVLQQLLRMRGEGGQGEELGSDPK